MNKLLKGCFLAALALSLVACAPAATTPGTTTVALQRENDVTITVTGKAGMEATPDIAQVTIGVCSRANTPQAARQDNAQAMNAAAQNALLKLLEEGPVYAAFLLLTDNPGAVLTTIRSRCEALKLSPVSPREAEDWLLRRYRDKPPEEVRQKAAACGGILGRAVRELEGQGDDAVQAGGRTLLALLAKGDELSMAEWCVTLEKWDRESMGRLLARAQLLLRDALVTQRGGKAISGGEDAAAVLKAAQLPAKRLLSAADTVEQLCAAVQFNVSSAHLAGALCARLYTP